jgi:transposase
MLVQQGLGEDPFSGALYAFRGRRAGLIKLLWHDGIGLCLLSKRIEQGAFPWPATPTGQVMLSPAQMSLLLEGLEWRKVQPAWRPTAV